MDLTSIVPDKVSTPAKLFLAAMILNGIGNGIINVVMQLYLMSLGFESVALGTLFMMNPIGAVLLTIPMGVIADRYGKGKILLFGFLMVGFQQILLLTTKSIEMLMLAFLFIGIANATGSVIGPLYASFFDSKDLDRAFGLMGFLNILSVSAGSLLGFVPSILVANYGYSLQASYWVMLAVSSVFIFAMLPLLIMAIRSVEEHRGTGEKPKFSLRSKSVVVKFSFLNIVSSIGLGTFFGFLPYYVNKKFGAESGALGTLYFVSNFVQAGSNIIAPRISKKLGTLKTIAASLCFATPFYLLIPSAPNFGWFSALYVLRIGVANISSPLGGSLFMKLLHVEEKATANSITSMASMGGHILAPKLGGQLMQQVSLDFPAYLGSGLYAIYAASYYFLLRNEKEKETEQERIEAHKAGGRH